MWHCCYPLAGARTIERREAEPLRLLHIIPEIGGGGPARSLLALVRSAAHWHPLVVHHVAAIKGGGYLPLLFALRRAGAEVSRGVGPDELQALVATTDGVLLHFWNTPEVWRMLAVLPPVRIVIWSMVAGISAPQRLNTALTRAANGVILTAPAPDDAAPHLRAAPVIAGFVERPELGRLEPVPHDGFNVDYVGTPHRGKIHPRFIAMLSRPAIDGMRVRIVGGRLDPAMEAERLAAPDPDRFACLGFQEDIAPILGTSDVFAYPLAERTYASSDKTLQEAMLAGVPPVILPHGGPRRFVTHGVDGIVAEDETGFAEAIEDLHRNPGKRAALGHAARRTALALFDTDRHASELMDAVAAALASEPVDLAATLGIGPETSAAELFMLSQDRDADDARQALAGWRSGEDSRLADMAASLDDDAFEVEGGVLHWRNRAPEDPLLRLWTAMFLERQGRHEAAQAERIASSRQL